MYPSVKIYFSNIYIYNDEDGYRKFNRDWDAKKSICEAQPQVKAHFLYGGLKKEEKTTKKVGFDIPRAREPAHCKSSICHNTSFSTVVSASFDNSTYKVAHTVKFHVVMHSGLPCKYCRHFKNVFESNMALSMSFKT